MKARRMFALVDMRGWIICINHQASVCRSEARQYVPAGVGEQGKKIAWEWALKHGWRVRPVIVSPAPIVSPERAS